MATKKPVIFKELLFSMNYMIQLIIYVGTILNVVCLLNLIHVVVIKNISYNRR